MIIDRFVLPLVLPSVGCSEFPRKGAAWGRRSCVSDEQVDGDVYRHSPPKQSRFAKIVVHGNRHIRGGWFEKVNGAEPEGGASELEDDGRVSFKMAHVGVTCRSTAHDIYREGSVIVSLRVWRNPNEYAVIDIIIVGALELSGTVLKGKGHLCVSHHVEGGAGGDWTVEENEMGPE